MLCTSILYIGLDFGLYISLSYAMYYIVDIILGTLEFYNKINHELLLSIVQHFELGENHKQMLAFNNILLATDIVGAQMDWGPVSFYSAR